MNTSLFVLIPIAISAAAAAQPQLTPLGRAGFTNSYATAISADGSVVAGFFDPGPDAFVWTAANGMTIIPGAVGTWSTVPYAVSSNAIVAGESRFINQTRTFRWTADAGSQDLGSFTPNAPAHAWAISDDGQVVVGSSGLGVAIGAFRWTDATGMVDLNIPESFALAANTDATIIAGNFNPPTAPGTNLFRWTQTGVEDLGTVGTNDTYPYFISPDGSIIVGATYETELFRAFRWTAGDGIQLLDLPAPAVSAAAQDASDDTSLIVGYWIDFEYEARGAVWTSAGASDLLAYLQSLNTIGLDAWIIRNAIGVSGDGSTIIGTGSHNGVDEAFIVTGLPVGPACPECAADYDQDGGVTGSDIGAFIADFEAGSACSDVDADGGVTGSDLAVFFALYEAGGC
jgi:probable HAF family extracellular repeat protein